MKNNTIKREGPKALTDNQCATLVSNVFFEEEGRRINSRAKRNRLIILAMLDTGLRVGELIRLRVKDLMFDGEVLENLVVRSKIAKGGRSRTIPLSERLKKEIFSYISVFFNTNSPDPEHFVFTIDNGCENISARQVQRICKIAGLAFIGIRVNPHMLRHTFGTRLMRIAPIEVVRRLMGHASLSSTQIYMHPDADDLKKAINRL